MTRTRQIFCDVCNENYSNRLIEIDSRQSNASIVSKQSHSPLPKLIRAFLETIRKNEDIQDDFYYLWSSLIDLLITGILVWILFSNQDNLQRYYCYYKQSFLFVLIFLMIFWTMKCLLHLKKFQELFLAIRDHIDRYRSYDNS